MSYMIHPRDGTQCIPVLPVDMDGATKTFLSYPVRFDAPNTPIIVPESSLNGPLSPIGVMGAGSSAVPHASVIRSTPLASPSSRVSLYKPNASSSSPYCFTNGFTTPAMRA